MSFCVYVCMFPVCPLCCFIGISMDPVSKINNDDISRCHYRDVVISHDNESHLFNPPPCSIVPYCSEEVQQTQGGIA